jgi:uncharacterized surface protein with fasciclin (FAS1) repeats
MKLKQITAKNLIYAAAVLFLLNSTACKKLSSYDYPPAVGTAYDILKNDDNFSYFYTAVTRAGLDDLLKGGQALTIYAPTNAAFTASGYTSGMIEDMAVEDLDILVKDHIVSGATDVKTITGSQQQTTLSGQKITVEQIGDLYYVNGGDILSASQEIVNGFLNVSSTLLVSSPTVMDIINNYGGSGNAKLTYLAAAIERASTGSTDFTSLLSGSNPYTLFAPNNGAFIDGGYGSIAAIQAADPETLGDLLKYHLMTGARFTTAFDSLPVTSYNGSPIYFDKNRRVVISTTTPATNFTYWYANGITFGNAVPSNLLANNGVVHTVSRFLPVPAGVSSLDYIEADTSLSMFRAIIAKASEADPNANFETMLSSPDSSFTVFAITNDGLMDAGYANEAAIDNEDAVVLADLLKYHMLAKRVNNISVDDGGAVKTLLTEASSDTGYVTHKVIYLMKSGGYSVKGPANVSEIPVIDGNIVTTNGIVNIIGSVLKP